MVVERPRSKGFMPEVSKKLNRILTSLGRHALHAETITFIHPLEQKEITISAEIPKELLSVKNDLTNAFMSKPFPIFNSFLEYLLKEKNFSIHTIKAYQNDIQKFIDFLTENSSH